MATSTYRMVAENTAAGTDIGDPVAAMDADRGDSLTYELGGTDAASFAIDAGTGQISTSAALDYETKMEHMVTVTATDGEGETAMVYVTIMVTNEVWRPRTMRTTTARLTATRYWRQWPTTSLDDIDGPTVLGVVAHYFAGL